MRIAAPLALLALAACSQPFEGRIADRLIAAGLAEPMARCMAERWVERLNVLQLRKIAALADEIEATRERLTVGGLIGRVRAMDDPEIVEVVTRSTLVCALSA